MEKNKDNKDAFYCDILFEYLRSILYDSRIQQPDFSQFEEPFLRLAIGLQFLQKAVEEMKAYAEDLSKGKLSTAYASKDNFLCSGLKNLHSNLNHLTWQAKQVAMGDYSQHVSYLGEFSDAFNTMISQLRTRESQLWKDIEEVRSHVEFLEKYNNLYTDMTMWRKEWIIIVDVVTREILFCNKQTEGRGEFNPLRCADCNESLFFLKDILQWQDGSCQKVWERGNEQDGYFRTTSFPMEWKGKKAFAHIVEDITEDKRAEEKLASRAYYDAGTGIHNRFFFQEYMEKQLTRHVHMVICFMDLDGLKYVNDHFGHNEGDNYIRRFVDEISSSFRKTDILSRIGGDEFCLVLNGAKIKPMEKKMELVRARFVSEGSALYPAGFSYGLVQVHGPETKRNLNDILEEADRKMYRYKQERKVYPETAVSTETGR